MPPGMSNSRKQQGINESLYPRKTNKTEGSCSFTKQAQNPGLQITVTDHSRLGPNNLLG
jgi:hypothetical protein